MADSRKTSRKYARRKDGGKGGKAVAKVPVSPGATVQVNVGQKGSVQKAAPYGGWNGGGGTNSTFSSYYPGTGGGASDIRIGGKAGQVDIA